MSVPWEVAVAAVIAGATVVIRRAYVVGRHAEKLMAQRLEDERCGAWTPEQQNAGMRTAAVRREVDDGREVPDNARSSSFNGT